MFLDFWISGFLDFWIFNIHFFLRLYSICGLLDAIITLFEIAVSYVPGRA